MHPCSQHIVAEAQSASSLCIWISDAGQNNQSDVRLITVVEIIRDLNVSVHIVLATPTGSTAFHLTIGTWHDEDSEAYRR
jgi:hypothetical protein